MEEKNDYIFIGRLGKRKSREENEILMDRTGTECEYIN
jgi:hypothetical protein